LSSVHGEYQRTSISIIYATGGMKNIYEIARLTFPRIN